MRFTLVAVLAGLCAVALATRVPEEEHTKSGYGHYNIDEKDFDKQYKDVLTLFKYVHQPTLYERHVQIAKAYSIEDNLSCYTNVEAVKEFLHYYHHGMLPQGEIFSSFYDYQLEQAIALFKVFYYAKDFETFYKTACWARYHLNQGMFLYSFSVALIHRPDTYRMVLPPIYEIYPYYFFNAEVIQKAQQYKQMWPTTGVQHNEHTIYANYSGWYLNLHPEQSLSYFTEDVAINAYYYYYNLHRPFWMNAEEYGIDTPNRGEEYYYFYQQLVARFYLERLSNDFGEIGNFDYAEEFDTPYYPSMIHQNGLQFSQRPIWARFIKNFYNYGQSYSMKGQYPYSYDKVTAYERRILDAIDAGFVYTEDGKKINLYEPNGFNTLGNLIEANPESVNARFYGHIQIFARHLLGYSFQAIHQYKVAPSALEHFETSLRDPAFWQLYKKIIYYFRQYQHRLPHYTHDELTFPGVKVESVHVDHLQTYFERYDVDITNAVYMNQEEFQHNNFEVRARQYRLNHKPFTYKINVASDKPTPCVVRVFIGPKYDEYGRFIELDENRLNFVEFDRFKYELTAGENVIERSSRDVYFKKDRTTYKQLYKYVMTGMQDEHLSHESQYYFAFPNRFLLPKGKHGGQTYQFYVIVTPHKPLNVREHHTSYKSTEGRHHVNQNKYAEYPMVGLGVPNFDSYPLGYPFNRPVEKTTFYVANGRFHDVVIYHEQLDNKFGYPARKPHFDEEYEQKYNYERKPEYRPYKPQYEKNYEPHHDQKYQPHYNQKYEPEYYTKTYAQDKYAPEYSPLNYNYALFKRYQNVRF